MRFKAILKYAFLLVLIGLFGFFTVSNTEVAPSVSAANHAIKSTPKKSKANKSNNFTGLKAKINKILQDKRLDGASTAVSIRKASNGKLIYSHSGGLRLHPASNMKILTSSAALDTLGPNHRFSTDVLTDGKTHGPVLQGNVYLRGKGDPTLLKKDLDQMAKELKKKGIRKIHGDLIGDDNWYDHERLSWDLEWSDETYYYGAQISALTLSPNEDYDAGTVIVNVTPGKKSGDHPGIRLAPSTDYVKIINKSNTVKATKKNTISVERQHGTNNIVITGNIPAGGERTREWIPVWEPTGYALDVFKHSLEEQGIKFIGNSKMRTGKTPRSANTLTSKQSMPLSKIYIPFLKLSNNTHAETLVKEMGKIVKGKGSWDKGLPIVEKEAKKFGVDTDTIQIRDGSGMSHQDMVTTDGLSEFLYAIQDESWFPVFKQSLPVAGNPKRFVGGTLSTRMKEKPAKGNVIAKDGYLYGISSLSGYATSTDGEVFIFSIMINNYLDGPVEPVIDEIATTLAKYPEYGNQ